MHQTRTSPFASDSPLQKSLRHRKEYSISTAGIVFPYHDRRKNRRSLAAFDRKEIAHDLGASKYLERGRRVMERGGMVLRSSQHFSALFWPFRIRNLILKISENPWESPGISQNFLCRYPSVCRVVSGDLGGQKAFAQIP